jgi:hypothetical protein
MRGLAPLRDRSFLRLWLALIGMASSLQMLEVVIGWQVYTFHRSALQLAWIGLAEFVPMCLFALPAGQLADRFPRRFVFAGALVLGAAVAGALVAVSAAGVHAVPVYLALAFGAGTSQAIGTPAGRAMPATLVPRSQLAPAMTLRSIAMQSSQAAGPALGGVLYLVSPSVAYAVAGCASLAAAASATGARPRADAEAARPAPGLESVLEGIRFLRHAPIVSGAILLDLFAVLFGGAVSLAPLFGASILHVGPVGVGLLRAAPAVGALTGALILTWRPLGGAAGRKLLVAVAVFGACTIVFGLSRSLPLSLAALAGSGLADIISVNVRATAVALATPDELRGRVLAVEMVFISASNQLGAFESGFAAFLVGAVPAVVGGGILTIALAAVWPRLFPSLAAVDRLDNVRASVAQVRAGGETQLGVRAADS